MVLECPFEVPLISASPSCIFESTQWILKKVFQTPKWVSILSNLQTVMWRSKWAYAHGGCDDLHHFFQQEQTCLGDDSSAFNSPHTLRSSRTLVHEHTLLHTATPTFWRVKQLASLALIVQQNHESLTPLHSNAAIIRITNLCGNKIIAVLTGKFIIINDNHLSSHRVWELIFKS